MNKIYRLIWNETCGAWAAVSETAKGRGKSTSGRIPALLESMGRVGLTLTLAGCTAFSLFAGLVQAAPPIPSNPPAANQLPTGGKVVAGAAAISQAAAVLNVNQSSARAAIDWQSFNVGSQAQVNFAQPSASSVTLNRVLDANPSQIFGRINANGQVFLTNPNGVYFSPTSSVDVGGFLATTHSVSNDDFMAGKTSFARNGATGAIVNDGSLNAGLGGYIALLAPEVRNNGVIVASLGTVTLAAGEVYDLQMGGTRLSGIRVTPATIAALVENGNAVHAPGGLIILSAQAANDLHGAVVRNSGTLEATGFSTNGGRIFLDSGVGGQALVAGKLDASSASARLVANAAASGDGGSVAITGGAVNVVAPIDVSGTKGGSVRIDAHSVALQNSIDLGGNAGAGGSYTVNASGSYIETTRAQVNGSGSTAGGGIAVQAKNLFSSGRHDVTAAAGSGGSIALAADTINLVAASLDASGTAGGGTIRIGGDFRGGGSMVHADNVLVSPGTTIRADATDAGNGGSVVVWSDRQTLFYGSASARGGARAGNGGLIEVSSKDQLVMGGSGDAAAPKGLSGTLLLDPKNIVIDDALGLYPQYQLIDPNPAAGNNFGDSVVPLSGGNVVVTATGDDFGASDAGAVYLFNRSSGALISTLTGSTANDAVGTGVTALSNGNYVVRSTAWNNGAATAAGAVTWGSGTSGVSGAVSATNSLVGSTANDAVGGEVTVLSNGNYVVASPNWTNGAASNAGAATWGSGTTGVSGAVSATNSLVGTTSNDNVGSQGVVALSNGNYVVASRNWSNGPAAPYAGAVTWGNGTTGVSGAVSAANSLVGSTGGDFVGRDGIVELTNGNYVVPSFGWKLNNVRLGDSPPQVGAATWGNGTTGVSGEVSTANSLVGARDMDALSSGGVIALTNGNYVVASPDWTNGEARSAGAVTWGNGTGGTVGVVSAANSLVGSTNSDQVGSKLDGDATIGVVALTNGNYVVPSPRWANGAGAATWGNGLGGTVGAVSAANSLVGTTSNDNVGSKGVVALRNGNYVVASRHWVNGGATNAGAVTWGNGLGGTVGAVSVANSLVGSTENDMSSGQLVVALTNGNYVVASPNWDNGAATNVGAVTWGNGASGTVGAISAANSLVGSHAGDEVGIVAALTNGNYVVRSQSWKNGEGFFSTVGAVTWGNGLGGTVGAVSAANSLVGSKWGDNVGSQAVVALTNGNYVALSSNWANGEVHGAGAATWGDGTTGIRGAVSPANSLVGTKAQDAVGIDVTALNDGNYVVGSLYWSNGEASYAGAVTWGNGLRGTVGAVSAANSLIGSTANAGLTNVSESGATSTFLAKSATDGVGGRVYVGVSDLNALTYGMRQSQTVTVHSNAVTSALNAGTNLKLQASNDITVNSAITANNPSGNGGNLTLQAGRSVLLNANITTDNGNLTLIANDHAANGVVDAQRDEGAAVIAMAGGSTIDAGSGSVSITLRTGAGNTNRTAGAIALGAITAASTSVVNDGAPTFCSFPAVSKAYGDSVYTQIVTSNSGGAINYTSSNTSVATVDRASGAVTVVGAGSATITASQVASGSYAAASTTYTLTVAQATPTLAPLTAASKTFGDVAFTQTTSSASSGAVSYASSNTAVATVNAATGEVTVVGAGSATITASQAAIGNYAAASTTYTLTVAQATPTLAPLTAASKTFGDAPFTQTASSASSGVVSYASSNPAVATVNAATGEVTVVGAGSATITASQAASGNYGAASATYALTVKAAPALAPSLASISAGFEKSLGGRLPFGGEPEARPPAPVLTVLASPSSASAKPVQIDQPEQPTPPVPSAPAPVTPAPPVQSQSSTLSAPSTSGSVATGGAQVSLVRPLGASDGASISVSVPKDTATKGSGFSFPLPTQVAEAIPEGSAVRVTTLQGAPLPAWLNYSPGTKSFTASATPDGSLPIQVLVTFGQQQVLVVILERTR